MSTRDTTLCMGFVLWQDALEGRRHEDGFFYLAGDRAGRDVEKFAEQVAVRVRAAFVSYPTDDNVAFLFLFEPVDVGETMASVAKALPEAERIGRELRELGFEVGEPSVTAIEVSY